ncbi:hypothetical protein [Spirosoma montaniterrae]|uniref:Outer membrane protein beta-barrel domain-containing protein n=1 Tax=Spirosoma montaniterrae TaxID=1178516 RepID=A0A1P9WY18_9BACT|nr:hypothetical protein [Spirosoma montaniterrae]AQG80275.1 hypothetical protein AWR27_13685 [Spirosoma montaniterrae]
MKRLQYIYARLLLVALLSYTVSHSSLAQQNLFNIPAGDLTPKNKFFFQHQSNFYGSAGVESKNHFVYGLGGGFEIGANVQNLKMEFRQNSPFFTTSSDTDKAAPIRPLFQLTAQKFFFLNDKFKTSIGTQLGTGLNRFGQNMRGTHFTYNTWVYEPRHHVKFVVGPYVTDRGTVGQGNTVGVLVGFEYPVHKKLLIMGDFISGNNATSVSVLGVNFLATKRIQLCLGGLIPNPNSGNKPGVVFELNILGFDDGPSH